MARTYFLPWPISANARNGVSVDGRKIKSARARKWYADASEELMLQRPKAIKGPVEIKIELLPPDKRRFDIDNKAKATLDCLVQNLIIEEDDARFVKKLTLELAQTVTKDERPGAYVTVSPLSNEKGA